MKQILYFLNNSVKTALPFKIGNTQLLNKHNKHLSPFKFFKIEFSDNRPFFIYSSRFLCTSKHLRLPNVNDVTYKEIKMVSNEKRKDDFIIDVRQPEELQETGVIPGSINVPCQLEDALKGLSSEEFEKKYGLQKPKKESQIIFSCKLGKRSREAQAIAQKLGYKNSKNYIGGWKDWEEHLKQ